MKKIKKMACEIKEELCGAEKYAECYVENKAEGNADYAAKFKKMATDELNHADILHEIVVEKIKKLEKIYTPPTEMKETWEDTHNMYIKKEAWIKQLLSI